jgi:hypothetical protein
VLHGDIKPPLGGGASIDLPGVALAVGQKRILTASVTGGVLPYTFKWKVTGTGLPEAFLEPNDAARQVSFVPTDKMTIASISVDVSDSATDQKGRSAPNKQTFAVELPKPSGGGGGGNVAGELTVTATGDVSATTFNGAVNLTAAAAGGVSPYTIQWTSNPNEGTFDAVDKLQVKWTAPAAGAAHPVSLTVSVTDSNVPKSTKSASWIVAVGNGPQVSSVTWENGATVLPADVYKVIVTFDGQLSDPGGAKSPTNTANYKLNDGGADIAPTAAAWNNADLDPLKAGRIVTLTFAANGPLSRDAKLTASVGGSLRDTSNQTVAESPNNPITKSPSDNTPPAISGNIAVPNATRVELSFNEPMDKTTARDLARFSVNGVHPIAPVVPPDALMLSADGRTVTLKFAAPLTANQLDITNVLDVNGNGVVLAGVPLPTPKVTSVQVVDGLNVDVTFDTLVNAGALPNAQSALDPANYTLSGTGQGTLAAHPNAVTAQGGNVYRLTWTAGVEMKNGGDLVLSKTVPLGAGFYYLHLQSWNVDGAVNNATVNLGPWNMQ